MELFTTIKGKKYKLEARGEGEYTSIFHNGMRIASGETLTEAYRSAEKKLSTLLEQSEVEA